MCSDFYVNHLPCCVPPSSIERFFFQKRSTKKAFHGGRGALLGKIYERGYIEGLMIRSCQSRGEL